MVAALAARDASRFQRVLPTAQELTALGLGEAQARDIAKKVAEAASGFAAVAAAQSVVDSKSKWINFGANRPGVIPAGWEGATRDVTVYDNASAIVDTDGKTAQISVGTLIQVDGGWRVIDLPANLADARTASVSGGYFFQQAILRQPESTGTEEGLSEAVQKLLRDLERLDKSLEAASGPEELAKLHASRGGSPGAVGPKRVLGGGSRELDSPTGRWHPGRGPGGRLPGRRRATQIAARKVEAASGRRGIGRARRVPLPVSPDTVNNCSNPTRTTPRSRSNGWATCGNS